MNRTGFGGGSNSCPGLPAPPVKRNCDHPAVSPLKSSVALWYGDHPAVASPKAASSIRDAHRTTGHSGLHSVHRANRSLSLPGPKPAANRHVEQLDQNQRSILELPAQSFKVFVETFSLVRPLPDNFFGNMGEDAGLG